MSVLHNQTFTVFFKHNTAGKYGCRSSLITFDVICYYSGIVHIDCARKWQECISFANADTCLFTAVFCLEVTRDFEQWGAVHTRCMLFYIAARWKAKCCLYIYHSGTMNMTQHLQKWGGGGVNVFYWFFITNTFSVFFTHAHCSHILSFRSVHKIWYWYPMLFHDQLIHILQYS